MRVVLIIQDTFFDLVHFPGGTWGKYPFKTGIALVNTPEYLGPDHVFVCDIPFAPSGYRSIFDLQPLLPVLTDLFHDLLLVVFGKLA